MLEAPNKHIMRAISFFVMGVPAASGGNSMVHPEDLSQLLSVSFQLNINRKSYQDTIIGRVPAGGGIHLQGSLAIYDQGAATVDGFQTATNGWPTRDNTYALAYGGIPLNEAGAELQRGDQPVAVQRHAYHGQRHGRRHRGHRHLLLGVPRWHALPGRSVGPERHGIRAGIARTGPARAVLQTSANEATL